ncbi:MAG: hypothetical protein K0M56_07845 [Kaistella sp.]|nr:hypothetical protein [Kaistella sp.]
MMDRIAIIEKTVSIINKLPEQKAEEISDFAAFILKKHEESLINKNITELTDNSKSYDFLREDEVTYSVSDIKLPYRND